jgi:hypothetical protein
MVSAIPMDLIPHFMNRVWGRTHDGGIVALVRRFVEKGETFYVPQFHPPSQISVSGRHPTEHDAQQEADRILAAHGHSCTVKCSRWAPFSN